MQPVTRRFTNEMNTSTTKDQAAIADYACVLSEAAYVLAALAESRVSERYDEFRVLQCIYSEAVTGHSVHNERHAPLAHHLSSMFSSVMAIGAILTPYDSDELPPVAVLGVHSIERLTKALSQALDGNAEASNLELVVRESQNLESGLTGQTPAPLPINLLSAVALADSRMASFTGHLTMS